MSADTTHTPDIIDDELGRLLALAAASGLITAPDLEAPELEQIAYVPQTGALVRVPSHARPDPADVRTSSVAGLAAYAHARTTS